MLPRPARPARTLRGHAVRVLLVTAALLVAVLATGAAVLATSGMVRFAGTAADGVRAPQQARSQDSTDRMLDAALTLLDTGCSAAGARTARAVIELDSIRRQLAGGDPQPGDDRFWFRVFGTPSADGAECGLRPPTSPSPSGPSRAGAS